MTVCSAADLRTKNTCRLLACCVIQSDFMMDEIQTSILTFSSTIFVSNNSFCLSSQFSVESYLNSWSPFCRRYFDGSPCIPRWLDVLVLSNVCLCCVSQL